MNVVVDASAFGPIFLPDERDNLLPGLTELLDSGLALVPSHWYLEVTNFLIVALRRGRLNSVDRDFALRTIEAVAVTVETTPQTALPGAIFALAERHDLTTYDAVYLAMARDRKAPLATSDGALIRAAEAESVELFGR